MGRSVGGVDVVVRGSWFVWNTASYLIDFVMPIISIRITLDCCGAYVRLGWREAVCRIGWEEEGSQTRHTPYDTLRAVSSVLEVWR